MAKILSFKHSQKKKRQKFNFIAFITSLPTSTKIAIISLLLIAVAVPVINNTLLELRQEAAPLTTYTPVTLRSDKTILVNNQPFFPIGLYSIFHTGKSELLDAMPAMATAGFNFLHIGADQQTLDRAGQLGMRVLAEGQSDDFIRANRNHPAIFGWNIGDDVHDTATPEEMQGRHNHVKSIDPNHLTYSTVWEYADGRWDPYLDKGDLVGPYSYPVSWGSLGEVDYAMSHALDKPRTAMIGIPQFFRWQNDRQPTREEFRNMTYQYLVNGVKGLLYYVFEEYPEEEGNMMVAHPHLWDEVTKVNKEVATVASHLMNGSWKKVPMSNDIVAATWQTGSKVLVIVVNTASSSRNASVPIPSGVTGPAENMFTTRPGTLSYANGRLAGSIGSQQVQVYIFGGRDTGTTPTQGATATPTATPLPTPTTAIPTNTPAPPTATPIPVYSLGGTVYIDTNGNGTKDSGETSYSGAKVSLSSGQTQNSTAASSNNFSFSVQQGRYTITLTVPPGYSLTTNNNPITISVTANTVVNFGIRQTPTIQATNTPIPPTTAPATATPQPQQNSAGNNSNTNKSGTVNRKTGDVNNDGKVNLFDLSQLLARWGTSDSNADLNKSGKVDLFDLSIVLTNWGK